MKKAVCVLLAVLMLGVLMAGCQRTQDVWTSYSVLESIDSADSDSDGNGNEDVSSGTSANGQDDDQDSTASTKKGETTKRTKKTTAKKGQTTAAPKGKVTRATKKPAQQLTFTPVEDKGADYDVKGKVSIAVDTARPTDYDAMFDVMQKLYPNITFEFDYWAHSGNAASSAAEYLSTRMATGTAANIIWDEPGEIPTYITNHWILPVTDYVAKDPEAKNIPANIKESYTYFGELFAVPHQATIGTLAFNLDLLKKLGGKLPSLEWSMDDLEDYLKLGGAGFSQGLCVAVGEVHEAHSQVSFYNANAENSAPYARFGYNYNTKQADVKYVVQGANTMRAWRMISGAEGWFQETQTSGGKSLLQQQLGITSFGECWPTGKALFEDTMTCFSEDWGSLTFNWKQWTYPNKDGCLNLHVDHCFITTGTPKEDMDACFQALRFMSYSTNGNLARLTMYEDSQKDKYNLNSHVYYPVTTNSTIMNKFINLSCTDEVDEYLIKNISNSSRGDINKIVPQWTELTEKYLYTPIASITDGRDVDMVEPVTKWNAGVKQAWADLEKDFNKYYK